MRILIVEDDAQLVRLLTEFAERHGTAKDGTAPEVRAEGRLFWAIEAAREQKPHFIILDLSLLNGAGIRTTAEQMRQAAPKAFIAVYSGVDPEAVLAELRGLVDLVVVKGSPQGFVTLRHALERAAAEQEKPPRWADGVVGVIAALARALWRRIAGG